MPTVNEINTFRRYIGDISATAVVDADAIQALNDAAEEVSSASDHMVTTNVFDLIAENRKSGVILKAAINYWWNIAGKLSDKYTKTLGSASEDVGTKWDRAMQMIEQLQAMYDAFTAAFTDTVNIGNLSRFSKNTLTRLGGVEEELTDEKYS